MPKPLFPRPISLTDARTGKRVQELPAGAALVPAIERQTAVMKAFINWTGEDTEQLEDRLQERSDIQNESAVR